ADELGLDDELLDGAEKGAEKGTFYFFKKSRMSPFSTPPDKVRRNGGFVGVQEDDRVDGRPALRATWRRSLILR
ncbi:MAG: hypothetical protein WDZ48_10585, partial [Pirellulales bacterium]